MAVGSGVSGLGTGPDDATQIASDVPGQPGLPAVRPADEVAVPLVVPNVLRNLFKGYKAKAIADITAIENACTDYATENNMKYPESIQELVTPDETGRTILNKEKVPTDPWGHEYQYEPPSGGQPYPTITCYGSDGVPGGEGDALDFNNHMIRNGEFK